MNRMERAVAVASRWSARLAGLVILASALLVALDVALRLLPGRPPVRLHAFELTHYGFAAAIAFAFAFALTERAHIRIDLLYSLLPLPVRAVLDTLALVSLAAMAAVMARQGWQVVMHSAKLGARPNSTLDIPMAAPQAIWAAGLTWFALVAALLAAQAAVRLFTGRFAALHAAAGVQADRREDADTPRQADKREHGQ